MNDRSGDGTGGFEVKIRMNTAKFTNVITARYLIVNFSSYLLKFLYC